MKTYRMTFQHKGKLKHETIISDDLSKASLPTTLIKLEPLDKKNVFFEIKRHKKVNWLEFFSELTLLLEAHIPLYDALILLEKGYEKGRLHVMIQDMIECLTRGDPIVKALEPYENYLDPMVVPFFRIAQDNGQLKALIKGLCQLLEEKKLRKKRLFAKLRYPCVLMVTFMVCLSMMFHFVIPQFERLFGFYNQTLPLATQILLWVKEGITQYGIYMGLSCIGITLGLLFWYRRSETFSFRMDRWIIEYVPYVKEVVFLLTFQRFFMSLRILLNENYALVHALSYSFFLIKNKYLLDKMTQLTHTIQLGQTVLESFQSVDLFDDVTLRLIQTGQVSNQLLTSVTQIETIYTKRLDEKIERVLSLIEPCFLVLMMVLIGWIIYAVLVPLWSMTEMIGI